MFLGPHEIGIDFCSDILLSYRCHKHDELRYTTTDNDAVAEPMVLKNEKSFVLKDFVVNN